MDWMLVWQAVSAIATCVLALGVFFAFRQIIQVKRSTNAQIAMDLFKELRNMDTIAKIRFIYNLKSDDFRSLSRNEEKNIDYVLDRFDTLGRLMIENIIDKELAIETYGGPAALRCWYVLCKEFIRQKQKDRGYYCHNYEHLTRCCLDYFQKNNIDIWFRTSRTVDDKELVDEFNNLIVIQKNELVENKTYPRNMHEIKNDRKDKNKNNNRIL